MVQERIFKRSQEVITFLYRDIETGCELCCYSKSDFFKETGLNNGGSMWNKLNKHIQNNEEDFFGYKVIEIEK